MTSILLNERDVMVCLSCHFFDILVGILLNLNICSIKERKTSHHISAGAMKPETLWNPLEGCFKNFSHH